MREFRIYATPTTTYSLRLLHPEEVARLLIFPVAGRRGPVKTNKHGMIALKGRWINVQASNGTGLMVTRGQDSTRLRYLHPRNAGNIFTLPKCHSFPEDPKDSCATELEFPGVCQGPPEDVRTPNSLYSFPCIRPYNCGQNCRPKLTSFEVCSPT